jgi:hypothetical protein
VDKPARFGTEAISRAIADTRSSRTWVLGVCILFGVVAIAAVLQAYALPPPTNGAAHYGVGIAISLFVSAVSTVLTATYQREHLRKLRGEEPNLKRMFSTAGYEVPLIALGILWDIPRWIAWYFIARPYQGNDQIIGAAYQSVTDVISSAVMLPFLFAGLFVIDQGDGLVRALGRSAKLFLRAPFPIMFVMAMANVYGILGAFLCVIGIIFTAPVPLLTTTILYEDNK